MKKLNTKTLKLNTETLRTLDHGALRVATGGREAPPNGDARKNSDSLDICDPSNYCY